MPHNAPPAAASAGFTWLMFPFPLSFSDLFNAYIRKPPALQAAGLLAVVKIQNNSHEIFHPL